MNVAGEILLAMHFTPNILLKIEQLTEWVLDFPALIFLQFVELDSTGKLSCRIHGTQPHHLRNLILPVKPYRRSARFMESHSSGKPSPPNSQGADPPFTESHSPNRSYTAIQWDSQGGGRARL